MSLSVWFARTCLQLLSASEMLKVRAARTFGDYPVAGICALVRDKRGKCSRVIDALSHDVSFRSFV